MLSQASPIVSFWNPGTTTTSLVQIHMHMLFMQKHFAYLPSTYRHAIEIQLISKRFFSCSSEFTAETAKIKYNSLCKSVLYQIQFLLIGVFSSFSTSRAETAKLRNFYIVFILQCKTTIINQNAQNPGIITQRPISINLTNPKSIDLIVKNHTPKTRTRKRIMIDSETETIRQN